MSSHAYGAERLRHRLGAAVLSIVLAVMTCVFRPLSPSDLEGAALQRTQLHPPVASPAPPGDQSPPVSPRPEHAWHVWSVVGTVAVVVTTIAVAAGVWALERGRRRRISSETDTRRDRAA
jgi:hypothetical protein